MSFIPHQHLISISTLVVFFLLACRPWLSLWTDGPTPTLWTLSWHVSWDLSWCDWSVPVSVLAHALHGHDIGELSHSAIEGSSWNAHSLREPVLCPVQRGRLWICTSRTLWKRELPPFLQQGWGFSSSGRRMGHSDCVLSTRVSTTSPLRSGICCPALVGVNLNFCKEPLSFQSLTFATPTTQFESMRG